VEVIRKVTVKNFRSIARAEFELSSLTLFVGQNDSGKSNFLRALNLFFNGQTDLGQALNFSNDFSSHATVGRGKARQIEVWLDIEPPSSFSDRKLVRWRRAWRENGTSYAWQDIKRLDDGKEIGGRSKVLPWLARIRYKYVPAIKGSDYFSALLRDVHDVLAETVDKELRAASTDFIQTIRLHTEQISKLAQSALGLESQLQLPTDLRALFQVLDFETSSVDGPRSLKQRGDGIKVRHIPAILKFLSDQERKLAGSGRARPSTIWGYEEPENNLELSRAFDHANELLEFSKDIQILVSTHSPAFYSLLSSGSHITAFSVTPKGSGTELHSIDATAVTELDENLGLMTLVAPYIASKAEEIKILEKEAARLASELKGKNNVVILTGGQTDEKYIRTAFDALAPALGKLVSVMCVGAAASGGANGGGDSNLLRFVKELSAKPEIHTSKIVVLLDCDVNSALPNDTDNIFFRKFIINDKNKKFKRGIENLFDERLAVENFYSTYEKTDEYDAKSIIRKLDKVKL
jgi:energy-coupling factor transporter ATP-binding protein EcfA2